MSLNFETDRIIWVTFIPSASGTALARMISASPDIFWSEKIQQISPLQMKSPHDWHKGDLGTCHYTSPLAKLPFGDSFFESENHFSREFKKLTPNEREIADLHLSQPNRFVQTTHLPDTVIKRCFPNCQVIFLEDKDPLDFSIRAYHEKFNKHYFPMRFQKALWKGLSLEKALKEFSSEVELYEGQPLTGLQKCVGKVDVTKEDIRQLYRNLYHDMCLRNVLQARLDDTIRVDRKNIFTTESFENEYLNLCSRLNISPETRKVKDFLKEYNEKQWQRADLT